MVYTLRFGFLKVVAFPNISKNDPETGATSWHYDSNKPTQTCYYSPKFEKKSESAVRDIWNEEIFFLTSFLKKIFSTGKSSNDGT